MTRNINGCITAYITEPSSPISRREKMTREYFDKMWEKIRQFNKSLYGGTGDGNHPLAVHSVDDDYIMERASREMQIPREELAKFLRTCWDDVMFDDGTFDKPPKDW